MKSEPLSEKIRTTNEGYSYKSCEPMILVEDVKQKIQEAEKELKERFIEEGEIDLKRKFEIIEEVFKEKFGELR